MGPVHRSFDESGNVITGTWESSPDGSSWEYWYDAKLLRLPLTGSRRIR
jgi:hypothetical protein